MCGVVGIAARDPINRDALASAVGCLRHRGPDDDGAYVSRAGTVGLGHTRLSIIDLSATGAQPMHSHDGRYTIVFNGEIYNFRELRRQLISQGCSFRGESDTEVLLQGFALHGPDILQRLSGIFAFAIHDQATDEVFLARDQLGVKPLYYSQTSHGVVFASEIKALRNFVAPELDLSAIRKYITFLWCPGTQTPLKSVKKLAPGSAMILRGGAISRHWIYWDLPQYRPRENWSPGDCAAELKSLIDDSVERQMVSDAPVGAFLSGGLDSSAVVAAAKRVSRDIQCFTIDSGEVEQGAGNDLPYARIAAAHLNVPLNEVRVSASDFCGNILKMVGILDEPLADPACLNVLFISEAARLSGIKVLLSGVGGDDLFAGYRRHTLLAAGPLWDAIPAAMRRTMVRMAAGGNQSTALGRRIAKIVSYADQQSDRRVTSTFAWGPPGIADRLLSRELRSTGDDDVFESLDAYLSGRPHTSPIEQALDLEKVFFLGDHNLIYTDKMAMAASVEVRVPLLDIELVKFAAEVPTRWKHRNFTTKWILRESQRSVLPSSIISRPKIGFGAPLRSWMRGEVRDMMYDLLSPRTIEARGLFDASEVWKLWSDDLHGRVDASYTLFSLMCIESWCRTFIDPPA